MSQVHRHYCLQSINPIHLSATARDAARDFGPMESYHHPTSLACLGFLRLHPTFQRLACLVSLP